METPPRAAITCMRRWRRRSSPRSGRTGSIGLACKRSSRRPWNRAGRRRVDVVSTAAFTRRWWDPAGPRRPPIVAGGRISRPRSRRSCTSLCPRPRLLSVRSAHTAIVHCWSSAWIAGIGSFGMRTSCRRYAHRAARPTHGLRRVWPPWRRHSAVPAPVSVQVTRFERTARFGRFAGLTGSEIGVSKVAVLRGTPLEAVYTRPGLPPSFAGAYSFAHFGAVARDGRRHAKVSALVQDIHFAWIGMALLVALFMFIAVALAISAR